VGHEESGAVNGLEPEELDAIAGVGEALGRAVCTTIDYVLNNSIKNLEGVEKTYAQLFRTFAETQSLFE